MRRKRFRKPVTNASLFPFIAVLICTMGAMIVLLVLVVQQARVQADTITSERHKLKKADDKQRKRLLEEQEDLDWQKEILEKQRAELTKKMAEGRLELSHLEDHIRRLEANLKRLKAEADQLRHLQQEDGQETTSQTGELQQLRDQIQRERQELKAAQEEAARRQHSYAIITYRGPNGTLRRPIYIECSESGIVIQPEGIVLGAEDFSGPLGPGNPLDAALRTIREHWKRVEGEAAKGEPYPLLIVRPDGAVAYSMARAAMASWDDEFGYELVDAQMELAYPPADPNLKRLLEGTIQTARQRQAILAAAMPSRFEGAGAASFAVPDRPTGNTGGGYHRERPAGPGTGGFSATPGRANSAQGNSRQPGGQFEMSDDAGSSRRSGDSSSGTDSFSGGAGKPSDSTGGPTSGAGDSSDGAGSKPGGGGNCPVGGAAGQSAPGPGGAAVQSIARTKGADWALPEDVNGRTAITRPIVVECHADRLVIRPDRGDRREPKVIPMPGATQGAIAPFVSAIHAHMQRWGMAVAGGYWKPVARVDVSPGAEWRFVELQRLLEGSGILVEKR